MNTVIPTYKFVIAINKTVEPGVAINAASHMALGLINQASAENRELMLFKNFVDGNEVTHPSISGLSLIVLRATAGELKKLSDAAREQNILHADFIETMTGGTYIEQLERTKNTKDCVYYGVALFGKKDILDPLTKRLSLYK